MKGTVVPLYIQANDHSSRMGFNICEHHNTSAATRWFKQDIRSISSCVRNSNFWWEVRTSPAVSMMTKPGVFNKSLGQFLAVFVTTWHAFLRDLQLCLWQVKPNVLDETWGHLQPCLWRQKNRYVDEKSSCFCRDHKRYPKPRHDIFLFSLDKWFLFPRI